MEILRRSRWRQTLRAVVYVAQFALSLRLSAQTIDEKQPPTSDGVFVPVEEFSDLQLKKLPLLESLEEYLFKEGWVEVAFMVDSKGKPYEPTIAQSSGGKSMERTALRAVRNAVFKPALLNGQPIDSASSLKIKFSVDGTKARRTFIETYSALQKAIDINDKVVADSAMANLRSKNLTEDAYRGIAEYSYAQVWGDDKQQLAGLRRAIAGEKTAVYLPKKVFALALRAQLSLQIDMQDYAGAMSTWQKLQKADVDKATIEELRLAIEQLEIIRTDNRAYRVAGELIDGSWHFGLFKKRFQIDVSEGHVLEIKLRCAKRYVSFAFDPTLEYQIADKYGKCSIELLGDPDSKFELIQF